MLKSLHIENLTVFPKADFKFGKNLNIIIGENGLGKTHLLKAIYSGIASSADAYFNQLKSPADRPEFEIQSKFSGVFRADSLTNLIHRKKNDKEHHLNHPLELKYKFDQQDLDFSFLIKVPPMYGPNFAGSVATGFQRPGKYLGLRPVFLPTRELLSIYPGFVSLYETTHLAFEETWRDTAILLGAPLIRKVGETTEKELLDPLEKAMGGRLELDEAGRFYLNGPIGKVEIHLLAEGLRKLATLARLIANGTLRENGYLIWDEPESNLNPKLVKLIARAILELSSQGIQVFIATHSLFLMRELFILQQTEFTKLDTRCFGLQDNSDGVEVRQGPSIDDVGQIAALDEDLLQSERYMDIP